MLKELNQEHFSVKIVKDLGMQLKDGNSRKMRYVLLECKDCGKPFERTVDNAKRRKETQCNTCKYSKQYPMKVLQWNTAKEIWFECNRCGLDFAQSDKAAHTNNKLGLCKACKAEDINSLLTYSNLDNKLIYVPDTGSLAYSRELCHLDIYDEENSELRVGDDGRVQFCGNKLVSKARLCLWLHHGYDISHNRPVAFKDGDKTNYKVDNLEIGSNGTKGVIRPDKYTKEYISEKAKPYISRKDFKYSESKLYAFALNRGWLQEVLSHMPHRKTRWTLEKAMAEAKMYNTREDFKRGCEGAYDVLRKNFKEYRDDACAHMEFNSSSDNDAVYIWRALGLADVYKIGMTSCRLGRTRIDYVAKESGLEAEIVMLTKVGNGLDTEKKMSVVGSSHEFDRSFNGSTEFRKLNEEELAEVIEIACKGRINE